MLTDIYIEAILADEETADQVWELWDAGVITNCHAAWAWWLIASVRFTPESRHWASIGLKGRL